MKRTTPEYEETVTSSKKLEATGEIRGDGYDMPDGDELGHALVNLSSLYMLARYRDGNGVDAETREAEARHADKLLGTIIDDVRGALFDVAQDAKKTERDEFVVLMREALSDVWEAMQDVESATGFMTNPKVKHERKKGDGEQLAKALERIHRGLAAADKVLER